MAFNPAWIPAILSAVQAISGPKTPPPQVGPGGQPQSMFTPAPTATERVKRSGPVKSLPVSVGPGGAGVMTIPPASAPVAQQTPTPQQQTKPQGLDFKAAAREFAMEALKNLAFQRREGAPQVNPANTTSTFQGGVTDPFTILRQRRGR